MDSFTERKEHLLQRISIETLLPADYRVKRDGRNLSVDPCPFCGHKDCFKLTGDDFWRCFSEDQSGDLVDFWMRLNNLASPGEALSDLEEHYGTAAPIPAAAPTNNRTTSSIPGPKPLSPERWQLALSRMDAQGPHWDWFERYGIIESAWRGLVGFEPEHPDTLERRRPALLIPELTPEGAPTGRYKSRYIDEPIPEGLRKTKTAVGNFLIGSHLIDSFDPNQPVVVCAGEKDWLVARSIGLTQTVTPAAGEGSLPDDFALLLQGFTVVLALDADAPGKAAAKKHIAALTEAGLSAHAIAWPRGWLKDSAKDLTHFVSAGHQDDIAPLIARAAAGPQAPKPKPEPSPIHPDTGLPRVVIPGLNRAILDFAKDIAVIVKDQHIWFIRNNEPVVVRQPDPPRPGHERDAEPCYFQLITPSLLRTEAEVYMNFVTKSKNGVATTPVARDKTEAVLSCTAFKAILPKINHLHSCPMPYFDPHNAGALAFTRPGYNPDCLSFCTADFDLLPLELPEAIRILLQDLLGDFCFSPNSHSLTSALAMFLTPFVVSMYAPILRPGFILRGNRPGVGKTFLATLVGCLMHGSIPAISPPSHDAEELRKLITCRMRSGATIFLLDNLKGRLDSSALEAFLTSTNWSDRTLGVSEAPSFRNDMTLVITSNGLTGTSDLARRCIPIDFEFFDESIDDRRYRHTDLQLHVIQNRRLFISAIAALIRHWDASGRPQGDSLMTSYETWSSIVGGILQAAQIPGFLLNRPKMMAELDSEGSEMRELLVVWIARYANQAISTGDLFTLAKENSLFAWYKPEETRKFGKTLARYKNRVFGNVRIIQQGKNHSKQLCYRLVNSSETPSPDLLQDEPDA
jgi:hypothetical protein